jgi:hypothetical protein
MTALALYACSHVEAVQQREYAHKMQAACDTLAIEIERRGFVANPDGPDYPTYASAMLLVAVERLQLRLDERLRQRLVDYLLESQIDQAEGYAPDAPDFGGWDLEGSSRGPRSSTGTNISVGATVSEALSMRSRDQANAALDAYRDWLDKCHNLPGDGGFFFHAQRGHDGNKAGWASEAGRIDLMRPLSYGSATADGLRGLKACGADPQSEPFRAGIEWLQTRSVFDRVPGFESSPDNSWSEGLLFYYWYALAKSMESMPREFRPAIAGQVRRELLRRQTTEGFWQNASSRMREDDPLIATSFAIITLAILDEWDGSRQMTR